MADTITSQKLGDIAPYDPNAPITNPNMVDKPNTLGGEPLLGRQSSLPMASESVNTSGWAAGMPLGDVPDNGGIVANIAGPGGGEQPPPANPNLTPTSIPNPTPYTATPTASPSLLSQNPMTDYSTSQSGAAGSLTAASGRASSLLQSAPATYTPPADTTVEGRLNNLLDQNSQYMQGAKAAGLSDQIARGTLNSTMAGEAGQAAAIKAALPIATSDATFMQGRSLADQAT